MTGEFEALARLAGRLGEAPAGEVWAGDDGAVVDGGLVVATDPMVEGVHFLRSLTSLADAGWKAVARNVSDVAAMGAAPWRCVVSVVGVDGDELAEVYDGLLAAAERWSCPVVGGDLASGPAVVVTVTILGRLPEGAAPLLRSGARAGDGIYVSAPLGWGAAGLRQLREDVGAASSAATTWYARPEPSVEVALAARAAGATAAIDISDGVAQDLDHVARASGVGLRIDDVPVAGGATLDDALHGGDEYHLAFTCPDPPPGPPPPGLRIGTCTDDPEERTFRSGRLAAHGWEHTLDRGAGPTRPL